MIVATNRTRKTRSFAFVLAASVLFGVPVMAETFPSALTQRLAQGLQACRTYYETGQTPMVTLPALGFVAQAKTAQIAVPVVGIKRKIFVRTILEGLRDNECEVHTNFDARNLRLAGFALVMRDTEAAGYRPLVRQNPKSDAKTIFTNGTTSMFMKVRVRGGKLMLKYKRRTAGATG